MVQSTLKADWKVISHMSQWCQSTKNVLFWLAPHPFPTL